MLRAYDDSAFIRAAAESKLLVILETFSYVGLSVDAMAQFWNKKFELYFSRLKDPSAIGQNFFAQKLSPDVGYYIFPQPCLGTLLLLCFISGIFRLMELSCCLYGLVSPFFNFVFSDGKHSGEWAVNMIRFRPTSFIWDPCVQSSTFKNQPSFDVVAIHFSFKDVGWNCFSRDQDLLSFVWSGVVVNISDKTWCGLPRSLINYHYFE